MTPRWVRYDHSKDEKKMEEVLAHCIWTNHHGVCIWECCDCCAETSISLLWEQEELLCFIACGRLFSHPASHYPLTVTAGGPHWHEWLRKEVPPFSSARRPLRRSCGRDGKLPPPSIRLRLASGHEPGKCFSYASAMPHSTSYPLQCLQRGTLSMWRLGSGRACKLDHAAVCRAVSIRTLKQQYYWERCWRSLPGDFR